VRGKERVGSDITDEHGRLDFTFLFERYNIDSPGDLADAARKLDAVSNANLSTARLTFSPPHPPP